MDEELSKAHQHDAEMMGLYERQVKDETRLVTVILILAIAAVIALIVLDNAEWIDAWNIM